MKEKLIQKDILIGHLKLKSEKYESEIFEKNILLVENIRKNCDNRNRESISSLSTISTNNYEYDKLVSEKVNIEDTLVKLKLKYANSQSNLLDFEDKNKVLCIKLNQLEKVVENQIESLKLKEDIIKVLLENRKEVCVTDPSSNLDITIKKKLKKQNSFTNVFKGLFKK